MLRKFSSKIFKFINNHFSLFLLAVVFISLGQMIFMDVWQDDQALFFKLAHINEPAGFFGDGPFGAGPYRYAATPFIPIYHFFKFNTYAYFAFMLTLYGLATIALYKTFKLILGDTAGKVSGFLFAAGYITSDGAYRMANSVTTSFSVIFVSLILYSYWKYLRKRGTVWYILALIFFFLSQELAITRMHYFFAVIIIFEIIFFIWGSSIKKISFVILRLIPFFIVFYHYMISGGDPRVGESSSYFFAFLNNKFYLYYGFFASLANLIIPDWLLKPIFNFLSQGSNLGLSNISRLTLIFLVLFSATAIFFIFKKSLKIKITSFILIISWLLWAKNIFNTPFLSLSPSDFFSAYIGGIILIIYSLGIFYFERFKKILIFLGFWLVGNIIAYSAYFPTVAYETTNRYLTHSFLPLVAIYGLIFSICIKKKGFTKYIAYLIMVIAFLNIFASIQYQQNILISRSFKTKSFYSQLKTLLPEIKKGDIIFFDLADSNQGIYKDAISAAMMPDTTSFAWRYGIDRYDFKLTNDFNELLKIFSDEKKNPQQVHSFWFSGKDLVSTSKDVRKYLQGSLNVEKDIDLNLTSNAQLENKNDSTLYSQEDIKIDFEDPIKNLVPLTLSLIIKANPLDLRDLKFPLINTALNEPTKVKYSLLGVNEILHFFEYQKFKNSFYQNLKLKTSSNWQDRVLENLMDQDSSSVWQSDRVLWRDNRALVEIELPTESTLSKLVWVNGFPNNTPISYSIESSLDGKNWTQVLIVNKNEKIIDTRPQIVSFKPTKVKHIRMVITATIGGDSPSLSEIWVVPSRFNDLEIEEAENYLTNPFLYISEKSHFFNLLNLTSNTGKTSLYWKNDKSEAFQRSKDTQINIIYDGIPRVYETPIPAGGLNLSSIMLSNFTIPGDISILNISSSVKPLKKL